MRYELDTKEVASKMFAHLLYGPGGADSYPSWITVEYGGKMDAEGHMHGKCEMRVSF